MASEDLPANGHGGPADATSPGSPQDALHDRAALRRHYRDLRRHFVVALLPGERTRLEADLRDVLAAHLPPGVVAGYAAVGSEIALHAVPGVTLFPRVVADAPLTFHRGPLVAASRGVAGSGPIPEPAADAPAVDPDIVLVPLLAVDAAGTRLGQGGGYYDRTLADLRARRRVLAIGIAWEVQRVAHLPAAPWDAPLDALATPAGWYAFTTPAGWHDPARSPMSAA